MATTLQGWVEVKRGDQWFPAIRLDTFVETRNLITETLFGFVRGPILVKPLAANRGVPTDLSSSLSPEVSSKQEDDCYSGFTYALYSEIEKVDWSRVENEAGEKTDWEEWQVVFHMMDLISKSPFSDTDAVRMVVWLYQ